MNYSAKCLAGVAAAGFLVATILAPPVACAQQNLEFWQGQSIYQIITDRFFDGDASNNNAEGNYSPANSGSVHGGDFRGIEQKLDYIKALGATAIWISPVVLNGHGQFHGYAARDFYQVAPHWGSMADLQQMIQAAHARGILVINDIIVNHGDDLIYSTDSGYGNFLSPPAGYRLKYRSGSLTYAPPFALYNSTYTTANNALTNLFHHNGGIPDYNTAQHVELGELLGLDDFRTESAYVRSNMVEIYKYWIGQAGFDGFRVDTVKHVEMGFWQNWCPPIHAYAASIGKSNFFMFGEVYDGSDSKCGMYTGTQSGGAFALDSVVDYPLYFKIGSVFASASGNTKQLEDRYGAIAANYDPAAQMRLVTFLDNHDQGRFLSIGGATADRLNMALAFLYTGRGIPCLYYGTEQAFNGTTDPNDREDMFDGQFEQGPSLGDNFNMTHPQFQRVAKLNNFRRLYPALLTGAHVNQWNDPDSPGLFAYARRLGTQEVFVVFNTATSPQTLTNRATILAAGTRIVNLFDTNEVLTVTSTPEIPPITVPGTTAKIFVAQSDWRPLDPVVTGITPAHDSASVSTLAPLVIQFSQPMDTGSVVSAFSTLPAVSGTFAWSAAHDTLTFTPGGTGFPAQTMVTVRIAATAQDAMSSNSFYAAFESRYKTGTSTFVDLVPPTVTIQTPTNGSFAAGHLTVSGTAADNVAVQSVEVRLDAGAWTLASGSNPWSYLLNTSNLLNGEHLLSARVTDTASNVSATNSVSVRLVNVPGSYLQRISGGNPSDVTDCAGSAWVPDQAYSPGSYGYSDGTAGNIANTITGICASAQTLYQRERYSTSTSGFRYWFDCPIGLYETTLLEADTWVTGPGQRIFNVLIEGQQVLTNFDIYAAAGGKNLPLTRVFTNTVNDGQLEVLFLPVTDNARISGIQVRKIGDLVSGNDGIPDWWRLAYFDHATGQAADESRAEDDSDGDGMSNLAEFQAGTNPLDANSVFKFTGALKTSNEVQLLWSTRTNKTYQLQQSDELGNPAVWTNFGPAITGTDGVVTQSIGPAAGAARAFRVQAN